MARSTRQSKILEIIKNNEIETQDELVNALRNENFEITQATISRDIKELGLIKILSDNKKYKYAYVDSSEQQMSSKYFGIFRESIISINRIANQILIKTLKGVSSAISSMIDKMGIKQILGSVYGEETVLAICEDENSAQIAYEKLSEQI